MTDFTTPDELTPDSTLDEVAEAAYYKARISDSTYHGTNYNASSTVISNWARIANDMSPAEAYRKADIRFERLLEEQTA